jgi:hypothetical protein
MHKNNKILIAKKNDADEIMEFIRNEWKKDHILAINKKYLLYEYQNKNSLNFLIFKNSYNKIAAILGFLKSSSNKNASVWTTMWKVSKSNGFPILGINMLNYLRRKKFKSVMSVGINLNAEVIFKYLKFTVGSLSHYYIINKSLKKYKIAIVPKRTLIEKFAFTKDKKLVFKKIDAIDIAKKFDFEKHGKRLPFKNFYYFKKRFFEHPIYSYDVYGVFDKSCLLSILVTRIQHHKKSTCLRIVDFYGKESTLSTFIFNLVKVMKDKGHEYIDLLSMGLDEKIIFKAGFSKLNFKQNELVIPNYFDPFIQSNIKIRYFSDTKDLKNLRIYKGDGDQDRPSSSSVRKKHD